MNDSADEPAPLRYSEDLDLVRTAHALLQRDKGRDLLDLAHALTVFDGLDAPRVAHMFVQYLAAQELGLSRAQAEERMFAKLAHGGFVADIRPLLAVDEAARLTDEAIRAAFAAVFTRFIAQLPGAAWARTAELSERFGIDLGAP